MPTDIFASVAPLEDDVRSSCVDALNVVLASTLALSYAIHKAHWNVSGALFPGLHPLFDAYYSVLGEQADVLAEHVTALGGVAAGTAEEVVELSMLAPFPREALDGLGYCRELLDRSKALLGGIREAMGHVDQHADVASFDVLTDLDRAAHKYGGQLGMVLRKMPAASPAEKATP